MNLLGLKSEVYLRIRHKALADNLRRIHPRLISPLDFTAEKAGDFCVSIKLQAVRMRIKICYRLLF